MTRHVTIKEFEDQLPTLIEQVGNGDEIVIDRDGQAVAKLIPVDQPRQPRQPGSAKGQMWIADDFNDPLPDEILEDFYR